MRIATNIHTKEKLFFESINAAKRYGFNCQCIMDIANKVLTKSGKLKRRQHKGYTFSFGGYSN